MDAWQASGTNICGVVMIAGHGFVCMKVDSVFFHFIGPICGRGFDAYIVES